MSQVGWFTNGNIIEKSPTLTLMKSHSLCVYVCTLLACLCEHSECKHSIVFTFLFVCLLEWLKFKTKKEKKEKKCKGIGAEQQENDDAMILQQQKQNVLLKIHQRDLNISINRWRLESKRKKKMQVKEIVFDNYKGLIVLLCLLSKRFFYRWSQLGKRGVWFYSALLTWVTLIYVHRLKGANGTAMWIIPCISFRGGIWQCFIVKAAEQFPC